MGCAKAQSCETVESEKKGEAFWVVEAQAVIRGEGKQAGEGRRGRHSGL